jgi:hypothetical protein
MKWLGGMWKDGYVLFKILSLKYYHHENVIRAAVYLLENGNV